MRSGFTAALLAASTLLAAPAGATETLKFQVFLGDDPIGEHRFELTGGEERRVLSEARFDVNILIFKAYRYRHQSREVWRDGCLTRIDSTTDDNGTDYEVRGERRDGTLALEVNGAEANIPTSIPTCIGTFAYWDRAWLERPRLLNPQTGELVETRLQPEGRDRRNFRGQTIEVERFRLQAEELDITLWYTPDGEWIGLESDTGTGRTLRYERV